MIRDVELVGDQRSSFGVARVLFFLGPPPRMQPPEQHETKTWATGRRIGVDRWRPGVAVWLGQGLLSAANRCRAPQPPPRPRGSCSLDGTCSFRYVRIDGGFHCTTVVRTARVNRQSYSWSTTSRASASARPKRSVIFILNLSDSNIWNHCTWRAKRPFDSFPTSAEKVQQGAWDPT